MPTASTRPPFPPVLALPLPLVRRLVPWAAVGLVLALIYGGLASVHAQGGTSAADAIPIDTSGQFSGVLGPNGQSLWFQFAYTGGNTQATISVTYEPPDDAATNMVLYTGDPANPRPESSVAARTGNTLAETFADPNSRTVYVQVVNSDPNRTASFVGAISPSTLVATPTPSTATPTLGTVTPTPTLATTTPTLTATTVAITPTTGPLADNAGVAITVGASGAFAGTIAPHHSVWYRFWYGNAGATTTLSVNFAPAADNADLNLYTGDPASPSQQGGSPSRTGNALSRTVNLASQQYVYFSVANNTDAQVVAYGGTVSPAYAPPATPTPIASATPLPVPTTTPQPAPPIVHDQRYYSQTGYRIDNDLIWNYFNARGQITTFGYPVSRTFTLLGCQVQMFQRLIAQICGNSTSVQLLNMLDPDIFPYTHVNGSTFPAPDPNIKGATPPVTDPNYGSEILDFVRANAPDVFQGQDVLFGQTFFNTVSAQQGNTSDPNILGLLDLEIWGAPISAPQRDPNNSDFIYQRFQRGIMHRIVSQNVTEGILLADYLKAIIRNVNVPADLQAQAQGNKYANQYCPSQPGWICRPADLPGTNFQFAFEPG